MPLDRKNLDDDEIKRQVEKNRQRVKNSWLWRAVFTFYSLVLIVLSFFLGIPFRLYWYYLLWDRRDEMEGIRPYWSLFWAIQLWIWPNLRSDGTNEVLTDVHMGCLIGRCATGQLHYYGWEMSTQVMKWNVKNHRPAFNFARNSANDALDALIEQMDKCGYRPKKKPVMRLTEIWQLR